MKFLCIFVAAACFVSASAQTSADSKRIMSEFKTTVATFDADMAAFTNSIYGDVELRAQAYLKAYISHRDEIEHIIPHLSARGQAVARRIRAEIDVHVAALRKAFDDKTVRKLLLGKTTEVRNRFVGALEIEIRRLQYFVDANPKHARCWDENKAQLQAVIDRALSQSKTVIQLNLNALDLRIKDVANKVDAAVKRIKADVAAFQGDRAKINTYFEKNYAKINTEFKSYRRLAISAVRDNIKKIYQGLDVIYKKAAQDYKEVRRNVVTCLQRP